MFNLFFAWLLTRLAARCADKSDLSWEDVRFGVDPTKH